MLDILRACAYIVDTNRSTKGATEMTSQTITKNPSGDLCQHDAYADLCIVCHPEPTFADMDDRQRAIWHIENALDALQHPGYLEYDQRDSADIFLEALVCAARLERIMFPEDTE
jgi:hypothetical protein